jgi:hypothetical protein
MLKINVLKDLNQIYQSIWIVLSAFNPSELSKIEAGSSNITVFYYTSSFSILNTSSIFYFFFLIFLFPFLFNKF